jgi:hypothetical protein
MAAFAVSLSLLLLLAAGAAAVPSWPTAYTVQVVQNSTWNGAGDVRALLGAPWNEARRARASDRPACAQRTSSEEGAADGRQPQDFIGNFTYRRNGWLQRGDYPGLGYTIRDGPPASSNATGGREGAVDASGACGQLQWVCSGTAPNPGLTYYTGSPGPLVPWSGDWQVLPPAAPDLIG